MPELTNLQFYLTSIEVKDPRASYSVKSVNQDLPPEI